MRIDPGGDTMITIGDACVLPSVIFLRSFSLYRVARLHDT